MDTTKVGITVSDEAVKKGGQAQIKKPKEAKKEVVKKKKEVKDAEQSDD